MLTVVAENTSMRDGVSLLGESAQAHWRAVNADSRRVAPDPRPLVRSLHGDPRIHSRSVPASDSQCIAHGRTSAGC